MEQEHLVLEETAVTSATPDSLIEIVQNKQFSEAARRQLQTIVGLKTTLVESIANLESLKTHTAELTGEQTRLRQNIDSLNPVKGQEDQVRQYSAQLAANEAALAKLRDQRDAEAQRKRSLDNDLRTAIAKLQF